MLAVAKGLGREEKSELAWSRWRCMDTNSAYIEGIIKDKDHHRRQVIIEASWLAASSAESVGRGVG